MSALQSCQSLQDRGASSAAFPRQHAPSKYRSARSLPRCLSSGLIADTGGFWNRCGLVDVRKAQIRFTDPTRDLQPVGFVSFIPEDEIESVVLMAADAPDVSVWERASPRDVIGIRRPDSVDDLVSEMRRKKGVRSEGDEGGRLYFLWSSILGSQQLMHVTSSSALTLSEVDVTKRRDDGALFCGGVKYRTDRRSKDTQRRASSHSKDLVEFETKYDQECYHEDLLEVKENFIAVRMCVLPSQLGDSLGGGSCGRELVVTGLCQTADTSDLLLIDVWNHGKTVVRAPIPKNLHSMLYDTCFHQSSSTILVSGDAVAAFNLEEEKFVWTSESFNAVINPERFYEIFSVAASSSRAVPWDNSVFVGAYRVFSLLDARCAIAPQVTKVSSGYVRDIVCTDSVVCVLDGNGPAVHDLRMLGKPDEQTHKPTAIHAGIDPAGCGGRILPLAEKDCFVSCCPDVQLEPDCVTSGMSKWRAVPGEPPRILKATNWSATTACLCSEQDAGDLQARVESEERIQFSLSCEHIRLVFVSFVKTIVAPLSYLEPR